MPDRKRIAEYFLVVGLPPDNPQPLELSRMEEEDDDDKDTNGSLHPEPITDIAVVNATENELPPRGFVVIKLTPTGHPADLNSDSFNAPAMYLCVKRGRDKPPLTEIGVFYHPKEGVPPPGHDVLRKTPYGRPANVSNTSSLEIYLTYKRASSTAAANCPVVTDACIILGNKEEIPPHAFIKIDKSLNKGLLSSPVYVCYKSSRVRHHQLAFTGSILSRYPTTNYPECPLSESVPLFCLPTGAVLEAWPARNDFPHPECSTFVLTDAEGVKLYGSSLSFYEAFDRTLLSEEQYRALELDLEAHRKLDLRVFTNKAIVIISLFPFFDAFKKFLQFLYARIHQKAGTEALEVPLEKYVQHFLHEVPCPSPHMPNIELSLNDTTITLRMIEDQMNISQGGASFVYLLSDLGADNAISLLMYTLTEQKLLVHSLRQDRLTRVCEAIISIIFPLQWQCAYIPLCPLELSGLLHAPVPFIYGFDSRYFDFSRRPPGDVICVDLDAKLLHVPADRKYLAHKLLPKRPLKVLKTSLEERLVRIRDFEQRKARIQAGSLALNRLENEIETSIKECFLRFMACLLRDYRDFLVPIHATSSHLSATDSFSLFNIEGYQRSKDRAYQKFYSLLLRTQMFSRFIEENSLGSPGRDEMLAFFEECTQNVDEARDTPPLLERDKALVSEHTKLVLPPEGSDPSAVFLYNGNFPCLDKELMSSLQPVENTALSETPGDNDSGITETNSSAPATDDSALPPLQLAPCCVDAATGSGTPRTAHRTMAVSDGAKPAWLRIKHEQAVTNKIGRSTLSSKARDKVWPCHLLSAAYCLWFPMVPAYLNFLSTRQAGPGIDNTMESELVLRYALDLIKRMLQFRVIPVDQVCYRVLLHMAAMHRLPQLAMDVLAGMQYGGVQPNAVTYALYNQVLLELGVVSDSMEKAEVSSGCGTPDSNFRSAMKRSLSDDGQLDSVRTPHVNAVKSRDDVSLTSSALPDSRRPRGLSQDDGGYGTLRDGVDTAVSEIRHFVKEQSTRAITKPKSVNDSPRTEKRSTPDCRGDRKADNDPAFSSNVQSPPPPTPPPPPPPPPAPYDLPPPTESAASYEPLPSTESAASCDPVPIPDPPAPSDPVHSPDPPTPSDPVPSPDPPAPSDPIPPSNLPASCDPPPPGPPAPCDPASATPADGPLTSEHGEAEQPAEKSESAKTLPIIRRPKRPSIIRNRSLTAEDRRSKPGVSSDKSREDDGGNLRRVYHLYSMEAGLLSSMTPTPKEDSVFILATDTEKSAVAAAGPLAESTPLSVEMKSPGLSIDPDKTPMASASDVATPTPRSSSMSEKPLTAGSPRRVPVRNLQSLFEEKSELHISFMAGREKKGSVGAQKRFSHVGSGSTFSVDSRLSTETEEEVEDCLEEEATSTEEEEDWSGLTTFFQLARKAGLTTRLGPKPGTPVTAARSSTLSLPQGSSLAPAAGDVDSTSMTSRGSADNALSAVSNFKRNASIRMKDAASRFSQKMASMRLQWNSPAPGNPGSTAQQPGALNRSTGELRSNSYVGGSGVAVPASSWLSASVRRLRNSQDSSVGFAGDDSEEEDSDSSETPCKLRDIWKHLSGVGTSPLSSQPSSHRPSVASTPTSPTDEAAPTSRRIPPLLILRLSSCSACVQCRTLIYDEDIMNGWTHEASNLNTQCPYCQSPTLPRLSISLALETEGKNGSEERLSCLYLSPLALRKVMETVFQMESPDCLQQIGVIDAHPELFWNYLWYITRLQLPNHLLHLVGLWWSHRRGRAHQMCRVRMELKWDSWGVTGGEAGMKPLYRIWMEKHGCPEDDPQYPVVKHMERILDHIKASDMNAALDLFLEERRVKLTDRSAYREILFLSIQALGRPNINIDSFVYFYNEAHKLALEKKLDKCDKPPARGVIWCRTLFPVLEL